MPTTAELYQAAIQRRQMRHEQFMKPVEDLLKELPLRWMRCSRGSIYLGDIGFAVEHNGTHYVAGTHAPVKYKDFDSLRDKIIELAAEAAPPQETRPIEKLDASDESKSWRDRPPLA